MTLNRRISIFSLSLLLLVTIVAAGAAAIVWAIHPLLCDTKVVILDMLTLDDAVVLLSSVTSAAVALTVMTGLSMRRAMLRRLREFQLAPGVAATNINDQARDELDHAAQRLNEMSEIVAQLRSKERDDEAQSAKRFADNIVHSMFDVLIVTDPDLNIVRVNQAACTLLGYTEIELVGKQIEEVFKEESITIAPPVRQMLKNQSMRDNEMTYKSADGRLVSALVSASTMRDNSGRPLAIITVGKDITGRKQIEHDLLEAKTAAESANRAKSAFVANMSHEIRTPMTAILGYADLLTRPAVGAEERERCIQTICRNGRHLLSIINDILDVSKIEAGKMNIESISCSPAQIVNDVAALMSNRAADKNLAFTVHYTGAVPQTIQTDPTRLRQVLMNLMGNAIKFTEKGGVKLLISLVAPYGSSVSHMRFDVADTGMGLDSSQIETLFRPFVQADSSTTRKFGGTGLGLTISRRLAKMLGGDLTVRSAPGQGSTFSLTIDTGDLDGVAMIENPSRVVQNTSTSAPSSPTQIVRLCGRVLLAEDGPDNRVLISYYLREVGIDVTAVENGLLARERAIEAVKLGRPFDLILMDMQMPEMDGYEATRQLRSEGYARPIVALTAHAMGGDREKCLSSGCDDFAVKPIEWEKLLAVLKKYVQEVTQQPGQASIKATDIGARSSQLDALLARPGTSRLVEKFVSRLDDRLNALRAAAEAQDQSQLRTLAHQLKGAAGGYGFPEISSAAADLEHAEMDNLDALDDALKKLVHLCDQARQATPVIANSTAVT